MQLLQHANYGTLVAIMGHLVFQPLSSPQLQLQR